MTLNNISERRFNFDTQIIMFRKLLTRNIITMTTTTTTTTALLALSYSSMSSHTASSKTMFVRSESWCDEDDVTKISLRNERNGTSCEIVTYGATILSFKCPDRYGNVDEVTIQQRRDLNDLKRYDKYYGATCGRVANRIEGGQFELDGNQYSLATNNGNNTLHGGIVGFDKVIWSVEKIHDEDQMVRVTLKHVSEDGDEGFPGNLTTILTISLSAENNELAFEYECTTDKATPLNVTNHTYWNLSGNAKRNILTHQARVNATKYTKANSEAIPLGTLENVQGGPLDLTVMTRLSERVPHADGFGMPGIDHNYVIDRRNEEDSFLVLAAELYDEESGRHMSVFTTEPGVQVYTMNWASTNHDEDHPHTQHNAICFEAQHFPNSINTPSFPSTVLRPGQVYRQRTVHRFSTADY